MRRALPIGAALAWLGFAAMITGIDQARLDNTPLVFTAISTTGFLFALSLAFTRRRWMLWVSLLLSLPVALWSLFWLTQVISLLRWSYTPLGRQAHPASPLAYTSFLWFCLFVTAFMLLLPIAWSRQLRRSGRPNHCDGANGGPS